MAATTGTRERSFWGWGWADRFPGDAERQKLKGLVEDLLGFPERPLLDPPSLDDAEVPEPRIDVPKALADLATADREARIRRTYGRGYPDLVRGFRGDFAPAPDVVARPRTEDEVAEVLAWAAEERVAVVPYGGGTSVVGGVEPDVGEDSEDPSSFRAALTLDLGAMDAVLDVDEHARTARIQAGATGPAINDALADHGLSLRHYPQSYEFSTLGGWVATRAGGHFATGYTRIDDLVVGLRLVVPAGTLALSPVPSSGAGPDPRRLVLGSEGVLGVVTEATVRLQPRPRFKAKTTATFEAWPDGVEAARRIVQAGLGPENCRLLDATEAMINQVGTEPTLLLAFESHDEPRTQDVERALALVEEADGTCPEGPTVQDREAQEGSDGGDDEDGGGRWRRSFLDAPYLFNALVSLGVLVETVETSVSWSGFPDLDEAFRARVGAAMEEACGTGVVSCRFTHVYPDGPAPYYTLLAPVEPGEELGAWRTVKGTANDVLADHGAATTHHHAVGRVHRSLYEKEVPEAFVRGLKALKGVLDPAGVMNPGVLLPP